MSDETLFHLALEKPAAERPAFLKRACAGDDALRQRVEALLRSHETPDSFLVGAGREPRGDHRIRAPSGSLTPKARAGPDEEAIVRSSTADGTGSRIGPYKLLQQIGEGGMGTVYMAEQTAAGAADGRAEDHQGRHGQPAGARPVRGRAAGAGADGSPQHRQGARCRHHRQPAARTS